MAWRSSSPLRGSEKLASAALIALRDRLLEKYKNELKPIRRPDVVSEIEEALPPEPSDWNPYQITGIPRNVVKAWVTVRFGTKGTRTRWPSDSIKRYAEDNNGADLQEFKIGDVEREFCRKYPLMARWRELKHTWADLMWLESEAVVSTVTQARQRVSRCWIALRRLVVDGRCGNAHRVHYPGRRATSFSHRRPDSFRGSFGKLSSATG
jgi:hypothetical protein